MERCPKCKEYVASAHLFHDFDGELKCIACLDNKEKIEDMKDTIKVSAGTLKEAQIQINEALNPLIVIRPSEKEQFWVKVAEARKTHINTASRLIESLLVIA